MRVCAAGTVSSMIVVFFTVGSAESVIEGATRAELDLDSGGRFCEVTHIFLKLSQLKILLALH